MIDYADRPMSEVLQIDAANGTLRQHKIRYDYYFYSDNACATTAHFVDRDHVWRPQEEHMEYEGFHPELGEAHLWGWGGALHRIILGELGGHGKWKMGVDFSLALDGMLPRRIANWRTPWGQQLKMVSYVAPPEWDGACAWAPVTATKTKDEAISARLMIDMVQSPCILLRP